MEEPRLQNYQLLQRLDGSRWVARSTTGELVTVRLLTFFDNCEQAINREKELLLSMSHPNIVPIRECVATKNSLTIVEDSCDEDSLIHFIADRSVADKTLMAGIALGLQYLHSKKRMLHLRLSPKTIFVKNGKDVQIGGVSRLANMTQPPFFDSSNCYQQPQAIRDGSYGYEADVYSMGVIFLEIVSGSTIHTGSDCKEALQSALTRVPQPDVKSLIRNILFATPGSQPTLPNILQFLEHADIPLLPPSSIVNHLITITQDFWNFKRSGAGTDKQIKASLDTIREQAQRGNPTAMFLYGRSYQTLEGMIDKPTAKVWLLKAVEAGEGRAYVNLFNQDSTDGIVNLDWLRKGAALNDSRSIWTMGRQFGYGFDGIPMDQEAALALMKRLPDAYPKAKYDIVWLTAKIQGSQHNFPQEHSHYLVQGSRQGDRKAIQALSDCLDDQGKYREAKKLGLIALMMEGHLIGPDEQLYNRLGLYSRRLRDRLRSRRWTDKAAKLGSRSGKNNLLKHQLF